jgi:hypothetical protein
VFEIGCGTGSSRRAVAGCVRRRGRR